LLPCLAYWNIQRRAVFTRVYTPAEFCLAHSDPVKTNKFFTKNISGSNQKCFFVQKTNIHEKRSIKFAISEFCSLYFLRKNKDQEGELSLFSINSLCTNYVDVHGHSDTSRLNGFTLDNAKSSSLDFNEKRLRGNSVKEEK
jgi:hypothetical protein